MNATIVDDRVAGTRITVWDVLHYLEHGWEPPAIAEVLRISEDQVRAASEYIDEHRDYVMAVHRRIEERNARGNPPEVEAKLSATHAKIQEWKQSRKAEEGRRQNGAGNPGGCGL